MCEPTSVTKNLIEQRRCFRHVFPFATMLEALSTLVVEVMLFRIVMPVALKAGAFRPKR